MALLCLRDNGIMITSKNYGPLIAIITWFLLVAMIASVLVRLAIRRVITHAVGREDASIVVAMLIGTGQAVALSLAIQSGLGQHENVLTNTQLANVEKATYASDLLYVLTICFAKISVLQILRRLVVVPMQQKIANITMIMVIIWTVSSLFTLAFRCSAPQTWDTAAGNCINIFAFWAATSPFDIITELVIIILPIFMMWPVHVALSRKLIVIGAFIFRVLIIAVIIFRLITLRKTYSAQHDIPFSSRDSTIATQFLLSLSIITACIPVLKPFLDAFDTGMLTVSANQGVSNPDPYKLHNFSGNSGKEAFLTGTTKRSLNLSLGGVGARGVGSEHRDRLGYFTDVVANEQGRSDSQVGSGSVSSTRSDRMIIKRSDAWDIENRPATACGGDGIESGPRRVMHSTL